MEFPNCELPTKAHNVHFMVYVLKHMLLGTVESEDANL